MKIFNFFNKLRRDPVNSGRNYFYHNMATGTRVDDESAMTVSAYYRGVIYLSSQIAKLPVQIKDGNNKILDNNVSTLLNIQPNPETTAYHLKLFLIQCAIHTGEGYAEIVKGLNGQATELWPLNPRRVSKIRDSEGNLWYRVSQGNVTGTGDAYLKPEEILVIRNIHTLDGFQGQGTLEYARTALGISLGADGFANALYANGALPSGILSIEGTLSEEASKRLAVSWKESVGGRKTGATAVLENGAKYSPVSHSPDILQFVETRKFGVIEIARFLGVPPIKLFDMDSAKYGNMEQVQLEVATDILDAWARNIEAEIDIKLLHSRKKGIRCELDLYAVFRGDMATRSTYFSKMMQSAAMTPNEIREREGMAPYKDGDRYFIATNNFSPMDRLDEIVDKQVASSTPAVDPEKEKEDIDAKELSALVNEYLKDKLK